MIKLNKKYTKRYLYHNIINMSSISTIDEENMYLVSDNDNESESESETETQSTQSTISDSEDTYDYEDDGEDD
jgi:hypothetical protein